MPFRAPQVAAHVRPLRGRSVAPIHSLFPAQLSFVPPRAGTQPIVPAPENLLAFPLAGPPGQRRLLRDRANRSSVVSRDKCQMELFEFRARFFVVVNRNRDLVAAFMRRSRRDATLARLCLEAGARASPNTAAYRKARARLDQKALCVTADGLAANRKAHGERRPPRRLEQNPRPPRLA